MQFSPKKIFIVYWSPTRECSWVLPKDLRRCEGLTPRALKRARADVKEHHRIKGEWIRDNPAQFPRAVPSLVADFSGDTSDTDEHIDDDADGPGDAVMAGSAADAGNAQGEAMRRQMVTDDHLKTRQDLTGIAITTPVATPMVTTHTTPNPAELRSAVSLTAPKPGSTTGINPQKRRRLDGVHFEPAAQDHPVVKEYGPIDSVSDSASGRKTQSRKRSGASVNRPSRKGSGVNLQDRASKSSAMSTSFESTLGLEPLSQPSDCFTGLHAVDADDGAACDHVGSGDRDFVAGAAGADARTASSASGLASTSASTEGFSFPSHQQVALEMKASELIKVDPEHLQELAPLPVAVRVTALERQSGMAFSTEAGKAIIDLTVNDDEEKATAGNGTPLLSAEKAAKAAATSARKALAHAQAKASAQIELDLRQEQAKVRAASASAAAAGRAVANGAVAALNDRHRCQWSSHTQAVIRATAELRDPRDRTGAKVQGKRQTGASSCKSCSAPALVGNYGFCGEHREKQNTTQTLKSQNQLRLTGSDRMTQRPLPSVPSLSYAGMFAAGTVVSCPACTNRWFRAHWCTNHQLQPENTPSPKHTTNKPFPSRLTLCDRCMSAHRNEGPS